jgi:hypothetical protein
MKGMLVGVRASWVFAEALWDSKLVLYNFSRCPHVSKTPETLTIRDCKASVDFDL